MRRSAIAGLGILLLVLNSCEMFKNSDSLNLTLRISEIGSVYYQDPVAVKGLPFIELYNYGDEAVELSDMELRCSASKMGAQELWEGYFDLPSCSIPAGAYILLRSNAPAPSYDPAEYEYLTDSDIQRVDNPGEGIYYISNGAYFPFWTNYGFAELVSQGQSVDFVRWGTSSIASPVEGQYESQAPGTSFSLTASGEYNVDSSTSSAVFYSKYSIGRIDEDTDTESGLDWKNYGAASTPGEANNP